jgi:hypothetical protein
MRVGRPTLGRGNRTSPYVTKLSWLKSRNGWREHCGNWFAFGGDKMTETNQSGSLCEDHGTERGLGAGWATVVGLRLVPPAAPLTERDGEPRLNLPCPIGVGNRP